MSIRCPKCGHIFPRPKKQFNGIEEFKQEKKRFQERFYEKDVNIILNLLLKIRKESPSGLTIDQACETLSELRGYKSSTIRRIAEHVQYRTGEISKKHINYFRTIARAQVAEPQIVQRVTRMRINE